jgi:hypothetical protein
MDDCLFANRFTLFGIVEDEVIIEPTESSGENIGPVTSDREFCRDQRGMRGERNTLVL